jgi:hypothetical protein
LPGTRESRMRAAHRTADAFEELGLPETRRCCCPEHEGENPLPMENFPLKTRKWTDGRVVKFPSSQCKACLNRKKRERRERRMREEPEEVRKQEKKHRDAYINRDPGAHREYQRIWYDAQRRANGVPKRDFSYRKGTDSSPDKQLEVVPEFKEWLKKQNVTGLEKDLELAKTTLAKHANGGRAKITLGLADRVIMHVNDGTELTDFWPDA